MSLSFPDPSTKVILALCGMMLAGVARSAADSAAAAAPSPGATDPKRAGAKPYTLFLGTDLSVEQQKQYYRVQDVTGNAFVINVHGEPKFVSLGQQHIGLRVDPTMKLATFAAQVTALKAERAYTPANDPRKKFLRENPMGVASAVSEAADMAAAGAAAKSMAVNANSHASSADRAAASQEADVAFAKAQNANAYNNLNDPAYYAGRMEGELAKEAFDAIDVRFEVSSPTRLLHPYAVVITTFHDPQAKPSEVGKWIYATALDPIDEKPQQVHLRQGGFPPGFELKGCTLHLYNLGAEVATNVAEDRVALTREEAFQYLVIEYLSANKTATLPATLTMMDLPADLDTRVRAGQFTDTYYVKVAKSGMPLGGFVDEACTQPADDPYLKPLFARLRFKPALDKGKPVEAVVPIVLNKLKT